ncbi:hypothetical protein D9613_010429 [Agrocybe pediades]|uniref:FAD/NAD(P)-binding domain-containing protein n=1 Tax=Agrocybe pediades TaxID=84607 RepID=A0A8H4QFN1_9AGAR|nr:hypothetical protein D9613_010429 [Agrocybe pediades]
MSTTGDRQNVVIVGGGNGGISVFNELSKTLDASKYDLILITPRPFFVHLPATIRMVVTADGNLEDTAIMPLPDHKFNTGNKKLVLAHVTSVVDDEIKGRYVTLDNGQDIEYSVMVLAPGSQWESPLDMPDTKEEIGHMLQSWRARFAKAQDVVIVGGGSIGIELAGELKDLQASLLLNDAYHASWRKRVTDSVTARGVNVVLDDYVDDVEVKDGCVTTRSGRSIPADLVVPTRGPRPNTKFIQSLGSDVLNATGYVKVSPTLQLVSHPRIFAAGDVIDWKEQKQSAKVAGHASVVSNNVLVLLGQKKKMVNYKGAFEAILITNGKYGDIAYIDILWGIVLGNWLVSLIKSRGLLPTHLPASSLFLARFIV